MDHSTPARTWLIGSAAALAVVAAWAAPAWSQAETHPNGSDCAVIQSATQRLNCTQQLGREMSTQQPFASYDHAPGPGPDNRLQMNLDNGGGGTQQPVVPNTTGAPATTGGSNETSPLRF